MKIVKESILNESKSSENGFGCVMIFSNAPDWPQLVRRVVDEQDIYTAEDDEYGFEDDPHTTILFGIHDSEVDKGNLLKSVRDIPLMTFDIDEIDIFENDDFDVVKFNIPKTSKLMNVRRHFEQFPHTKTFPDYNPHMTIAYVKKGEGPKYKQKLKKPIRMKFKRGVYSEPNYRKTYFDLKNNNGYKK